MCSLILRQVEEGASTGGKCLQMCPAGADTKANTRGWPRALKLGDFRPFEDCSERRGALVPDTVPTETVSEER